MHSREVNRQQARQINKIKAAVLDVGRSSGKGKWCVSGGCMDCWILCPGRIDECVFRLLLHLNDLCYVSPFLRDHCLNLGVIISHVYYHHSFPSGLPSRSVHTSLHIPAKALLSRSSPSYRIKPKSPPGFTLSLLPTLLPSNLTSSPHKTTCSFLNLRRPHASEHLPRLSPGRRCVLPITWSFGSWGSVPSRFPEKWPNRLACTKCSLINAVPGQTMAFLDLGTF